VPNPSTPLDPTLLLLQRISEDQSRLADTQAAHASDQHAVKLMLAEVNARLEPLSALPAAFADLRIQVARHEMQLLHNGPKIDNAITEIGRLTSANAQRSGWEGVGGKLVWAGVGFMGSLIVGISLALFAPKAKAAQPVQTTDLRIDNAANKQCWAVPAPSKAKPLWL
jgi:hypothetical protein